MFNRHFVIAMVTLIAGALFVHVAEAQSDLIPSFLPFHFDSQPPLTAQVGVPYLYTVHLFVKDSTATVRYKADRVDPSGFSVDSASGVVTWTPAARGWSSISITAVVAYTTHALAVEVQQRFMVAVAGGNGIVQGKVTDTLNVGIPNVVVEALQVQGVSPNLSDGGSYSYAARTDSNGNYRISRIDPGTYKLHAVSPSPQYASQWYDGKATAAAADKISVADSPLSNVVTLVDFKLAGGPAVKQKVTVSGIVTDSGMIPLGNSHVFFVRAGFAFNSNATIDDFRQFFAMNALRGDFRIEGSSAEVFQTKVDSLGNYSLQIPKGAYIAFAKAPGYGEDFYPGQSDMLSASMLVLLKDSSGIDFTLPKLPSVALGTIEGSVLDSALNVGVPSRIIASRDRWTSKDNFGEPNSYAVDTDSLGSFTVGDLLPGTYFIFAVPLGSFTPAYYTGDTVTTWWKKAAKVVINGNTATGIDIYVHEIPISVDGFAAISGTLSLASSTASTMAGAVVYAYKGSVAAGFAVTDVKGNYILDGLAPGKYSLAVDRLGYVAGAEPMTNVSTNVDGLNTGTVSYDASGNPVNASVPLLISSVAVSLFVAEAPALQPTEYALEQNYPNPFNPSTTIRYTLPVSGRVAVRVYNILGQVVATLVDETQNAGTYGVSFNASFLSSGVYFYRIQSGSFDAVKKMLLLK